MNTLLRPLVLVFAVSCCAGSDEPTQAPAPSPTTQWAGKGGPPQLPAEVTTTLDAFRQALRDHAWDRALSCCTAQTQARARDHGAAARYFRDFVPIDELLAELRYQYCGGRVELIDGKQEFVLRNFFLRLSQPSGETVDWVWSLKKTNGAWLVDLPDVPVAQWTVQEIARQRRQKEEADAKWRALEPKLKGLRTQLAALRKEYRRGQPMLFRLELVNEGPYELSYDHQQVAVNGSLTITFQDGRSVPYTAGPVQTAGGSRPIQPGATVVLFESLDIASQYDLTRPGKYQLQFNGHGLEIGDALGIDNGAARQLFPSNVVEIAVKP